ncbi:MAG: (2Fe-2S)-binding protein [Chloroflexota bacterium]
MADDHRQSGSEPSSTGSDESAAPEQLKPMVTRRDFLVGTGAGAVAVGVVAGGYVAAQGTRSAPVAVPSAPGAPAAAVQPAPAAAPAQKPAEAKPAEAKPAASAATTLPLTHRRVTLNIDGKPHDVTVDVRESLWETMVNELGMAGTNLGCDRAQCGACAVLVDGKAVNGCGVMTARLGRGQKITTVNGIASGPGIEGLHPIQKAFWWEGGYQCGICTRGFIVSTYALLQTNKSPTDEQIAEALAGNVCRCGEYIKIFSSVKAAAAEMRGEKVNWTAPFKAVTAPKPAAAAAPVPGGQTKQFEFVTPLPTIEFFDTLAEKLKERQGIAEVAGTERTVNVTWLPPLTEAQVRTFLAEIGNPVKP